ncbi:iron-containing redox enzyme family protein [Kineosporia sp. J2-2]|uniref:Iron-containing redox enzyme family protein n=1 Tax=Kineosporia corallincola TaxID=2835133 RepID=A0ABS5TQF1_9ACTN|nr:iron-containing redox enzyme family protein [Kineosporia corallincola]MBT0773316.1 iron-containing redox enzyme family protein [Kineosporia corallincola]
MATTSTATGSRALFRALVDPEWRPDDGTGLTASLRRRVHAVAARAQMFDPTTPDALRAVETVSLERLSVSRERALGVAASSAGDDQVVNKALLDLAPFTLTTGFALANLTGPWNAEQPYALAALRILAADVGHGQPLSSRADSYLEILRRRRLIDAGAHLQQTAADARICEGAFALPAALMLMARFPESCAGFLLGATLYLRSVGLLPVYLALGDEAGDLRGPVLDLGRDPRSGGPGPREAAVEAVREFVAAYPSRGAEVSAGYLWCRAGVETLHDRALNVLERWADPAEAVIDLFRRRRREAAVYHDGSALGGKTLQHFFAPGADPADLLEQLAASRYVKPGNPDRSPLVNGLISTRGGMFRIFSTEDVAVLRRWILALPNGSRGGGEHREGLRDGPRDGSALWADDPLVPAVAGEPVGDPARLGIREAYRSLLHRETGAAEHAYAVRYAADWLARAAQGLSRCPLPAAWEPAVLAPWLQEQHERQDAAFQAGSDSLTEERLKDDSLGLAPLVLIDGAWLIGFTSPDLATSVVGYPLFNTYWDELGNGVIAENHPRIYRDLIDSMVPAIAETGSAGFAHDPRLSDGNFALPVFWLSIGRLPRTHQPEILGLNLAMELSGVGGGYRSTRQALKRFGYSTLFVDLHNTIDNIATGHSAWAAAGIDAFMTDLPGPARAAAWERVRTGFVALNPPPLTRKQQLSLTFRRKASAR